LTQRLCRAVAEAQAKPAPIRPYAHTPTRSVDALCAQLFLGHAAREADDNLGFVRARLLKSEADLASLLGLYRRLRAGRRVPDNPTEPLCAVLKLSAAIPAAR